MGVFERSLKRRVQMKVFIALAVFLTTIFFSGCQVYTEAGYGQNGGRSFPPTSASNLGMLFNIDGPLTPMSTLINAMNNA